MKRIYARELLITIIGGLTLFYVGIMMAWQNDWQLSWLIGSGVALLVALVRIFVFTYQMWSAIQDGHARMTPRQAVLYSFIPVFNVYWLYQCIWGFSKDCNAYLKRHHISTPALPTADFLWYVTLWLLSIIPYVSIFTIPLAIMLVAVVLVSSTRALNAIQHARASS